MKNIYYTFSYHILRISVLAEKTKALNWGRDRKHVLHHNPTMQATANGKIGFAKTQTYWGQKIGQTRASDRFAVYLSWAIKSWRQPLDYSAKNYRHTN